jgi:hypothetical protein
MDGLTTVAVRATDERERAVFWLAIAATGSTVALVCLLRRSSRGVSRGQSGPWPALCAMCSRQSRGATAGEFYR